MTRLAYFIVGTQKGGTTALYKKLTEHPRLARSSNKEIHFFDKRRNFFPWPRYNRLLEFFPDRQPDQILGEATPIYMYWPKSIERIWQYNRDAKLIVTLRHPAYRAFSQWRMETAREKDDMNFADAVSGPGRERFADHHRVFSYVERGKYAEQIKRMLNNFPKDQLFFCTLDQQWHEEQKLFADLFAFLGVDPIEIKSDEVIRRFDASHVSNDENTQEKIDELTAQYADDIRATEQLTGLSLSHWLEPDYRDPII